MTGERGRGVHFVGSIKMPTGQPDTQGAMQAALDAVRAVPLHTLPDGETGPREWWVRQDIERQQQNPYLQLVKRGDYSSYQQVPEYVVRDGTTLPSESLGLRYARFAADGWPVLRRLREQYDRPDLAFQVGIPSPVDLAVFSLGFGNGAHHIGAFAEAVSAEIDTIYQRCGRDAVVQLETPAALTLALAGDDDLPTALKVPAVVGWLAKVVADAPRGCRIALHLCLGDMNNRTHNDKPLTSGEPISRLARELLSAWPNDDGPEYLHFPVAGGRTPPLLDPTIWQQLRGLRDVPTTTRLIAGIAHEAGMLDNPVATLHDQRWALRMIEDSVGRPVNVAAACGIARGRSVQASRLVMRRMVELVDTPIR